MKSFIHSRIVGLGVLSASVFVLATAPAHAQVNGLWSLFGSGPNSKTLREITLTGTGTTATISTLDLTTVTGIANINSQFSGGASGWLGMNGWAYDRSTDRFYFAVAEASNGLGNGGLAYYDRPSNTISLLTTNAAFDAYSYSTGSGTKTGIHVDNAAIYNGYYWFVQDQVAGSTQNIFRIPLSGVNAGQIQIFGSIPNSTNFRDFGDIAITAGGIMRGSFDNDSTATNNQRFFNVDVSGGSPSGYSEFDSTRTTGTQLAYGWSDINTLSGVLYASRGTTGSPAIQLETVNTTTGDATATLFTDGVTPRYTDMTSAPVWSAISSGIIPEPGTLALLGVGGATGLYLRRRRK